MWTPALGRVGVKKMKKICFGLLFFLLTVSPIFSKNYIKKTITYKQTNQDGTVFFKTVIFMDNIAILKAYNEDDVFILTNRKYNNTYERFGFGYPAFYADTGLFSESAYGVEGGPRSEIFKEQVETIDITEANKIYSKLVEVFRNEFILNDQRDSLKLKLFCNIVDYLNDEELRLLRNTLYAINHYEFKSIDLREIFESCSWYTKSNFTYHFNELENVFLKIIQLAEQKNKSNTVK